MINKNDERILGMLNKDAKLTSREISEKIGMPVTTVHNRIKKMEKDGIIKKYTIVVDNKKLGKEISAIVHVMMNSKYMTENESAQETLGKKLMTLPEVEDCYIVTGDSDIIIRVSANDVDDLHSFLDRRLRKVGGIEKTVTSIILKKVEI
ncbi:MAG TPA: Lrp/AsnC family transcriptional regulator [archaeon]|nr:Lrp/AsnC family transcriptional regulator [archaeon]